MLDCASKVYKARLLPNSPQNKRKVNTVLKYFNIKKDYPKKKGIQEKKDTTPQMSKSHGNMAVDVSDNAFNRDILKKVFEFVINQSKQIASF